MFCKVCQLEIFTSRSELCLACSAVRTQNLEFQGDWGSGSLRNLGTDIACSAARQIRALRLHSLKEAGLEERPFEAERPTERSVAKKDEARGSAPESATVVLRSRPEDPKKKAATSGSSSSEEDEEEGSQEVSPASPATTSRRQPQFSPGRAEKSAAAKSKAKGGHEKDKESGRRKREESVRPRHKREDSDRHRKKRRNSREKREKKEVEQVPSSVEEYHGRSNLSRLVDPFGRLPDRLLRLNEEPLDSPRKAPRKEQWRKERRYR